MTTLISFLGKSQTGGYRKTRYRFDSGEVKEEEYFGLALARHSKVDRLILVGTPGSMWDVFFLDRGPEDVNDELDQLLMAAQNAAVTVEMLSDHARRLSAKLANDEQRRIEVQCLLIGYARDDHEQIDLLLRLADVVREGEHVTLDVTHSFRHLPMLALVAARYLGKTRGVSVDDIYYGAADMTDPVTKEAPVLRLKGMLTMLDWVDALATYDKDGDYGVFAPLLEADGMDQGRADQLARAAFFERTSNPVKAREALHTVVPSVEGHGGKMARLFRAQLGRRLSWFRKPYRDEQELALADAYLARCDYLRAAVFMLEAWVSRAVATKGLDINDYETRKAALDEGKVTSTAVRGSPLKDLTALRNAMAHGLKSRDMRAAKNMGAESDLRQTLTHIRKQLFG